MSVPSNLIPTRVTQLPVAPVADENSLMMIVYQGNNYQIRVGDLLSVAGVPVTRQVIAGTSLQGGGQLSSNVTLSVAPGGISTAQLANSGVTPGVYGTATNIPVLTVDATGRVVAATTIPATISGYVPESRQVIAGTGLTGGGALNTDVTLNANLSNSTPQAGFQTGSAGVSTGISRADHKHPAVDLSDDDQVDNILGMDNGGTGRSLVPSEGGIVWSGADGLYIGPAGAYGQVLVSTGMSQYIWAYVDIDIPRPANTVRAGPVAGPDALPTFRALVNADLPGTIDGKTFTNVDINSGTIDGTAIGGSSPSTGVFTQVNVDNLQLDGNTLSTTNVNGDLNLSPNGSGSVVTNKVDINGGTIDGTTIGGSSPAAGTFTTVSATTGNITDVNATTVDSTNLEVTNLKAKDGTAAGSIANTTGVVTLNSSVLTTTDINGGTIDGTTIGGSIPAAGTFTTATATTGNITDVNATTVDTTNIEVTNLKAKDGTAAGSVANTTGVVTLNSAVLTTADVNGGTIDNTVIGGTTPAAGTFTSVDTDYVDFAPALSPLPADATGRLYYNNEDQFQTLAFRMNGSVVQKIGEEQYYRVKCSGSVTKGQVVMFAGTLGASGGLVGAAATGLTPEQSNYILGIATESGVNNAWITVTSFGEVKNINTTGGAEAWVQGQVLYYNPAVSGGLTKTKPTTPNAIAVMAAVVHVGTSNGILFVRPTFGSLLGGTDGNVEFTTLANGDVIVYDAAQGRWENVAQSTLSVASAALATAATNVANGAANQLVYNTGSSTTSFVAAPTVANTFLEWSGSAFQWSANPLGTVTSVGLSLPSEFNVTNSPVTSSGTLTGNWASQSANYIFAAPNGSSGTPTFRAMVAADVPTLNQNTTGSAGSVANAVTFNSTGGAATNSTFNGSSPLTVDYSTVGAPKADGTGASGTWGINISGNAATATSATSATSATTATNIAGGAAGSIPYQTGAGTTALLATSSGVLVGGTTPSYSTAPTLTGTNFTGIPNAALSNSSITLGTTSVSLGGTVTTLGGLTSVAVTQDPTTALQVATKQYVDTIAATSITYHTPVKYEVPSTTGNLNAIYNNGTAGVGATLTNNGTLAAFAPDGPTASPGDRILIYSQTNQFENGIYTVTTVGDGSTPWVLTRATDANSYGLKNPNALGEGDAFFVTSGNTGAGETYVCNTSGVITFGTTAITFVQVSSAQIYSAGTGLTLSGTQFSLSTPVSAANGGSGLSSYTTGDLLYASGTTTLSKLGIGATNRILTSSGSAPQWTDPSTVTVGSATTATSAGSATTATTATNVAGGAANRIVYNTGAGATSFVTAPITSSTYLKWDGAAFVWDTAGTGTVTSVGMTVPTGLSVSGTPVTGSGTLAVTFQAGYSIPTTASQSNWDTAYTDRLKWDGGATGLNAGTGRTSLGGTTVGQNVFTLTNPSAVTFPRFNADNTVSALDAATFRTAIGAGTGNGTVTSIVAGSFLTGGTITTTGTIAVDATSANTASKVVARDASGNFSAGTITATLNGNASTATTATSATSATTATTATNLAGGAASQIPYQTGSGATTFLANGTAGQVLKSNGASAPSWSNLDGGTF